MANPPAHWDLEVDLVAVGSGLGALTGAIVAKDSGLEVVVLEKAPKVGRIPENRTDAGVYLIAEFLGAKGCLYIKDEEGLYSDDPKKNPKATFMPEATATELLASGQDDLIVERSVLEYMTRARHMKEIQIINGLKPGNVTAALNGESVGTVIRSV